METGKILRKFKSEDGREVVLRTPRWDDLDGLLHYFNSLVREDLDVLPEREEMTRAEEADWLGGRLAEMAKDEVIDVIAEVEGKVVANSEVIRGKGNWSHVGMLEWISITSGYRNVGIGTEIVRTLIEEAGRAGLKILVLRTFGNNRRAKHVYEKVGFRETGRIPKAFYRGSQYIDEVIMTMEI